MTESNIKGMFERAKDQWLCSVIFISREMKRGGAARDVADMLLMHTSRGEYYRHGHLVAFPSLDRLAFMLGRSKSSVQRGIKKLIKAGLVTAKHRYNNSNFYCLTIPVAAEDHARNCLNLLTNARHRSAKPRTEVTRGVVTCAPEHDLSDHLHSDYPLTDSLSLRGSKDRPIVKDKEEKRVAEEVRQVKEERGAPDPSPDPSSSSLSAIFRDARRLGDYAGSIVGRALREGNHSLDDIREVIETVREDDGDTNDLASELFRPEG
jgi:hypothetical protein